jgi:hypothetical protein
MGKATDNTGDLLEIKNCYIKIPDFNNLTIPMKILPDISDSKSASFSSEKAIGRSMPFIGYESSESRQITWDAHFVICKEGDQDDIMGYIRALQACTYPQPGNGSTSYLPPPTLKLRCGELLSKGQETTEVCCILKSYSLKFDTTVPWYETEENSSLIPYKMDISLTLEVIYNQANLPGSDKILSSGA